MKFAVTFAFQSKQIRFKKKRKKNNKHNSNDNDKSVLIFKLKIDESLKVNCYGKSEFL